MDGQKKHVFPGVIPTLILALTLLCLNSLGVRAEIVAPSETTKITNAPLTAPIAGPVLVDPKPITKIADPEPTSSTTETPKAETPVKAAPEKPAAEKPAAPSIEQTTIRKPTETKDANAATTATAAPASTPMLPSGVTQTLQVAAALAVVLGLIFIGKAAAKKFVPQAKTSNGKSVIEILARHPLSKNQSLVLVRIGSQIVTLNQGKDSSQSVLVISDPNEVAKIIGQIDGQSSNSIQSGFNRLLANARMDLEDPANDPDREDVDLRSMDPDNLDGQLEEMAAAKRQLMELRQQVRSVRDSLTQD